MTPSAAFRLHAIETRDPGSQWVNVVVDTPRGSPHKYKYDEALGLFRLSRVLPAGMHFPHDFGSVPRTRAEDGDALDVLVLTDGPTFPGCLVTVRLLGVLRAKQSAKHRMIRNDRLIAAVATPVNQPGLRSLDDLEATRLREIEQFFVAYNHAHGRRFVPAGTGGPRVADRLLRAAVRAFAAGR